MNRTNSTNTPSNASISTKNDPQGVDFLTGAKFGREIEKYCIEFTQLLTHSLDLIFKVEQWLCTNVSV